MKPVPKEEIKRLFQKGDENLVAAEANLGQGYIDTAVSRAYYSMFYCAQALLLTKDLRYSRHTGVIAAVGEHFVKPGLLKPEIHRLLVDAFELRGAGDYDYMTEVSREDAARLIQDAGAFIEVLKTLCSLPS
jgi:uncharacterized protein (UPF0332 family)